MNYHVQGNDNSLRRAINVPLKLPVPQIPISGTHDLATSKYILVNHLTMNKTLTTAPNVALIKAYLRLGAPCLSGERTKSDIDHKSNNS